MIIFRYIYDEPGRQQPVQNAIEEYHYQKTGINEQSAIRILDQSVVTSPSLRIRSVVNAGFEEWRNLNLFDLIPDVLIDLKMRLPISVIRWLYLMSAKPSG